MYDESEGETMEELQNTKLTEVVASLFVTIIMAFLFIMIIFY